MMGCALILLLFFLFFCWAAVTGDLLSSVIATVITGAILFYIIPTCLARFSEVQDKKKATENNNTQDTE